MIHPPLMSAFDAARFTAALRIPFVEWAPIRTKQGRCLVITSRMGIGLSFAIAAAGCAIAGPGATPFEEESSSSDAGHTDARTTLRDAGRSYEASTYDAPPPPDASEPDTNVPPPPPTCNARLLTGIAACDQCLETSCCAQDEACSTSQDCMDFVQCGDDCFNADGGPTQACFDACTTAHPTGAQQMTALDACMSNSCGTACGM